MAKFKTIEDFRFNQVTPKPFFSIVIPTYNRAETLEKTLPSVLEQSFTALEVLIIDDGSTDDTRNLIESFNDPRVFYEWIPNSGGPATPRNRGIHKARSNWVCFLDADDWWAKNKLEVCFSHINANDDVDLIYHDLEIVDGQNRFWRKPIARARQLRSPVLLDLLLGGNTIANSSVVVRKAILEKVGGINESRAMVAAEDYNTWLKISTITENFLHIPQVLGYYRVHDGNISQKDMTPCTRAAVAEFQNNLSEKQQVNLEASLRYMRGRHNYLTDKSPEMKDDLVYALKNAPWQQRLKSAWMLASSYPMARSKNPFT